MKVLVYTPLTWEVGIIIPTKGDSEFQMIPTRGVSQGWVSFETHCHPRWVT